MKRTIFAWLSALLLVTSLGVLALGGGGAGQDSGADDTIKVSLKPLEEASKIYGWVRITEDLFSLGANRLEKDAYYAVYFVAGDEKEPVGENPLTQASGVGEVKFGVRLTEPIGGKWEKIVLYHQPNGEENSEGLEPVLQGSLR